MHKVLLGKGIVIPAIAGLIIILVWGTNNSPVAAQTETPPTAYPPLSDVLEISAESTGATCALIKSGGVECWGEASTSGAENILKISEAVALASGGQHSCVITRNGGVQCWGSNFHGELGDDTTEYSPYSGVEVKGLPGEVTALGLGFSFSCAVIKGEVWCWGQNDYGQLGDGTTTNHNLPKKIEELNGEIIAITAGSTFACALNTSGSVQCWGGHIGRMLGNTNLSSSKVPIQVAGLESGVVTIASRLNHTCALTKNGEVFCWGENKSGQLGNGETSRTSDSPVKVNGLPNNVSAISTGINHTCALTSTGQVLCWGDNRTGELGDGSNVDRLTPVTVNGLTDRAIGITAGEDYTCAIVAGGVQCWGENWNDQLGTGINPDSHLPVNVSGMSGATVLAAGGDTSCALTNTGVFCWGGNKSGQVGDGTDTDQDLPQAVQGVQGQVSALSIGMEHACALLDRGEIQCWGSNLQGNLGTEAVNWQGSKTAVPVTNLPGKATVVSAGNNHTCTITSSGLYCWGGNEAGQLGDGTTEERSTPTAINGLPGTATLVSAGFNYTCALTDNGAVFCWGNNQSGQLGNGTTENRSTQNAVSGLNNGILSIAAGATHTCALTQTGEVKCWGENTHGQLGDGTSADSLIPVNVSGLSGKAVALAVNYDLTCALLETGGLQCWGNVARVGNEARYTGMITTPTEVSGLTSGVRSVAVGRFHACALLENGNIQCWGTNWNGQLGNGSGPDSSAPLTVVLGPRREEDEAGGGFRDPGPLVPEITTYIPTPLDVSTQPGVIGTNLLLAALLMLPFSVAAELFTRTMGEHEDELRIKFRPVEWFSRLQKRLEQLSGTRFSKHPALYDTLKLIGVMAFYGLVFSLLDRTWNPFSLQGLILFFSMTIAYGVVGIADDILQWRTIRKWGLAAELTVRPTNFLLAMTSTTTSRLLSMVPGLMFGTPEALQTDESQFDEQKQNSLLKISARTIVFIGLGVWLPTIATAALQKLSLPEKTLNLIGGLEGFLLVIFAVSLENLFVQMLGFPGGFGQALKRRNKWIWLATLAGVTFIFYHTLINPRGELAEALQEANIWLFFGIAITFVAFSFGLHFYLNRKKRGTQLAEKDSKPSTTPPQQSVTIKPATDTASISLPTESRIEPSFIPIHETKQCPICGNQIKAEARLCRYCKATFRVTIRGYCSTEHQVMEALAEGKCSRCRNEVTDLHVESRLLKAPATLPTQITLAAIAPLNEQINADTSGITKPCPACGQIIKAEARICRFCHARFEVKTLGYCLNDHAIVEVKEGKCSLCAGELQDLHTESKLIGEVGVAKILEPARKPETQNKAVQGTAPEATSQNPVALTIPEAERLKRPGCVTAYAILLILSAGLLVLSGSFGNFSEIETISSSAATVIAPVLLLMAIIYGAAGVGLWLQKKWARVLVMLLLGLGMLSNSLALIGVFIPPASNIPYSALTSIYTSKVISFILNVIILLISSSIFGWFRKNGKYFR